MCARVYRASAELLTHTEPAVLWTPSTPASLAWEGFIQRSGRNVGGQALKGQSGGGRQEPLPHTCFCERADCSVKATETKFRRLCWARRPTTGRWDSNGLPFPSSLTCVTSVSAMSVGCLSCLLRFQGALTARWTSPAGKVSEAQAVGGRGPRAPVFNECLLDRGCGSLPCMSLPGTQHGAIGAEARGSRGPQGHAGRQGRSWTRAGLAPSLAPWQGPGRLRKLGVSPRGSRH